MPRRHRPNPGSPPRLAQLVAAIAPEVRRELLVRIGLLPGCVQDVAARMDLERSQVSKHLSRLRDLSLLAMMRVRHQHVYRIGPAASVSILGDTAVLLVRSAEGSTATMLICGSELERLRLVLGPATTPLLQRTFARTA